MRWCTQPTGARTPLGEAVKPEFTVDGLRLIGGPGRKRKGFFLRTETLFNLGQSVSGMHGFWERNLEQESHGEGLQRSAAAKTAKHLRRTPPAPDRA
jgi:predicted ATPase